MKLKQIVYLLVAAALIGGATLYYVYNKPHAKVEDTQGLQVTSAQLCSDFAADEAKANITYTGKALEISGTVSELKNNQDGVPVLTLAGNEASSVQCTMRDKDAKAATGKSVVIKGFFSSNDMFGPTVTDCVIIK